MPSRKQRHDSGATINRLAELVHTGLSTADAVTVGAGCGGIVGRHLQRVRSLIERGQSLASALQRACPGLGPHELAILQAGEHAGSLVHALELLDEHLERGGATRKRVVQALAYPSFLAGAACVVLMVMSITVLPSLTVLYRSTQSDLPATTAALLAFGKTVSTYGPLSALVGLSLLFAVGLARARFTTIRRTFDALALKLPVWGSLVAWEAKANLFRLLAVMLDAGTGLADALVLCTPTIKNTVLRERFERLHHKVKRGVPLANALRSSGLDPSGSDAGILHTAEAGKGYPSALRRLARIADVRANDRLTLISRAAEPAAVLFMAAVVAVGALGLYQPVLESSALLALQ